MPAPASKRFWRGCRVLFRCARIGVWLLLLALILAAIYLNQAGLPDFLKRPLLEELRARGVELEFSRLRLHWFRGLVAEDVLFGGAGNARGVELFAEEVELHPDLRALKQFKLEPAALLLHRGRFAWLLVSSNQPPKRVALENVETELRFLPGDIWQLGRFQARLAPWDRSPGHTTEAGTAYPTGQAGARLLLSGTLTNASAVRQWTSAPPARATRAGEVAQQVRSLVETFETLRFSAPPELNLTLHGDARDVQSFNGFLTLRATGTDTPWGAATNVLLRARLQPAVMPGQLPIGTLRLEADSAQTRWGRTSDLRLTLGFVPEGNQTNQCRVELDLRAGSPRTEWAEAEEARCVARWTQSFTNPVPQAAEMEAQVVQLHSPWGRAKSGRVSARLWPAQPDGAARADESWAWWAQFEPYAIDWQLQLEGLEAREIAVNELVCAGAWRAPELAVTNLHARLYQGELDATVDLNVATRAARYHGSADFEVKGVLPLLTEAGQRWLQQFTWEKPPKLVAEGSVVLPAWTNREPDWRADVVPTLELAAAFDAGPGSYRGLQVSAARGHAIYSNQCWLLPDLHLTRPEGQADLVHVSNDRTKEVYWRVQGRIDPTALRPLMDEKAQRGLDLFTFTQPPQVEGEIWAMRREKTPRGIVGRVAVSNFTVRGESAVSFRSALRLTNQVLEWFQPEVLRADGVARADTVRVDLTEDRLYLTNGFSTTDPMAVARAIGPKTAKAIEPYQFLQPPRAHVNGSAPLHGTTGFDLRFDLDGGPFRWWRFNLPHIAGAVRYTGDTVALDGIRADFYGGGLAGAAAFDLSPKPSADFHFSAVVTNANLQFVMRDLAARTNHLEGIVNANLTVLSANTTNWESWQGHGEVTLHDGLIWEFPMFGIFSPIFNSLVPGLGNSRFSRGTGTFTITNSVIASSDLELRAALLRMKCRGTTDFHERVNAKVEAELLRNTWVIGPLLSAVLWPVSKALEYKVTGTLSHPKAEPLYVPKLLLFPLQPFQTLKGIFGSDTSRTNAPPK